MTTPTGPTVRHPRRSRLRERNPLGNPLAVIGTALATFLALLAMMTARLVSGRDPALRSVATTSSTGARSATELRTRTSGTVAGGSAQGAAAGQHRPGPAAPITTRTSGTLFASGERDG